MNIKEEWEKDGNIPEKKLESELCDDTEERTPVGVGAVVQHSHEQRTLRYLKYKNLIDVMVDLYDADSHVNKEELFALIKTYSVDGAVCVIRNHLLC